ncbi:hypothetical protein E2320_009543 [Naja naja]|nr:hypothetical protein E2320_009543 [Naja naja]
MECHCLRETYNPVCGNDGITYYSPCHAGCRKASINHDSGEKVYHECSCIIGPNTPVSGLATAGKCTSSCERRTLLLIFMCVSDRQRSFALGIQWIVVRTLGSIPGPIAFGSMIDKSCLLWQSQCGEQGSCYPAYSTKPLPLDLSMAARRSLKMALVICRRANLHISLPTAMYSLWATHKQLSHHCPETVTQECLTCFFLQIWLLLAGKTILRRSIIVLCVCVIFHKQQKHMAKLESSSLRREKREGS